MIDTLFLDAGGVLVFPNWHRVADALARQGVEVSPATLAAAEPYAKREIDVPTMAATDEQRGWHYFNLILQHAGIPLSASTDGALAELRGYHARQNLWESVPPDVAPALTRLRDFGLRLVVLSNANGTLCACLDRLGLTRFFDVVIDSCDIGIEKPDPRLFRIALERAGSHAQTTMHVGDLYYVDVVGARAAGVQAMLLDAANLYPEADCQRVSSLTELATAVARLTGRAVTPGAGMKDPATGVAATEASAPEQD